MDIHIAIHDYSTILIKRVHHYMFYTRTRKVQRIKQEQAGSLKNKEPHMEVPCDLFIICTTALL